MTTALAALNFAPVPVKARENACIKVGVIKGDVIKLSINADAFSRLGRPKALAVAAATDENGLHFQKVQTSETGWPVTTRKPPRGESLTAACRILSHPFKPGVTHAPHQVEAYWEADGVVLAMPNWERMLDEIELANSDGD